MRVRHSTIKSPLTKEGYAIKLAIIKTAIRGQSAYLELTVEEAWQIYNALGKELKS